MKVGPGRNPRYAQAILPHPAGGKGREKEVKMKCRNYIGYVEEDKEVCWAICQRCGIEVSSDNKEKAMTWLEEHAKNTHLEKFGWCSWEEFKTE